MSYANGTTNYNLPQTVGTDKRDWFDTNKPFEDVDADLHEAVTKARESASDITTLAGRVSNVETAQSTQAQDIVDIKATQETQGTAITSLGNKIDDVEDDCLDMICAVDEGTAHVATVAVTTGHYFRYNNVLYIATIDIAIGDTIVPNTNCRATNVATELEAGGAPVIDDSITGLTTTWSSQKINSIEGALADLQTTDKSSLVAAINEVLSQIGGGAMPALDFANPLHTFSSGNLTYTASKDCYLYGAVDGSGGSQTITIDGTLVYSTTGTTGGSVVSNAGHGSEISVVKIPSGTTVVCSVAMPSLHIFDVVA